MILAGLATAAPAGATRAGPGVPPRVVSLNPCLDAILIRVADRSQILALSHYSRQSQTSDIAQEAATYPITYETAEEVAALKPDLVLESFHTAPETRAALERLGIQGAVLPVPANVAESLAEVRRLADLAGHPDRGEALAGQIEAAIAAAAPPAGSTPVAALVFQPNGFAAGGGTLLDDMLTRTGFRNVGDRYGIGDWGNVALERVIADPPELLLSDAPADGAMSWAERVISHPALASVAGRMKRALFPERLLYCGGPVLIDTAAALAAARRSFQAGGL
jgi:iron complex transport system substrate-binding protein